MTSEIRAARRAVVRFNATDRARAMLASLRAQHGRIALYITRGLTATANAGSSAEPLVGSHDIFLGTIDGVDIYEKQFTPEVAASGETCTIDVLPGDPVRFSLLSDCGVELKIEAWWVVLRTAGCSDHHKG